MGMPKLTLPEGKHKSNRLKMVTILMAHADNATLQHGDLHYGS